MILTSTLDRVTVYREGAVCRRLARATPPPGGVLPVELRLVGLPLSLDELSLRAQVLGASQARIVDVRPSFEVALTDAVDAPAEQRALEQALEVEAELSTKFSLLEADIAELTRLRPAFPQHRKGAPPRDAPLDGILSLAQFLDGRLEQALRRRRAMWRALEDVRNETELRRRRLAEASTATRTERARVSRSAVVTLAEPSSNPLDLALEYLTPGARWAPSYQLHLESGPDRGVLRMKAAVIQATGEDWTQVSLSLSTASLQRRTDLPELRALKVGRSQPTPPRPGWRAPPPGLDELFQSYEEALRNHAASSGAAPQPAQAQLLAAAEIRRKTRAAPVAPPKDSPAPPELMMLGAPAAFPPEAAMPMLARRRVPQQAVPEARHEQAIEELAEVDSVSIGLDAGSSDDAEASPLAEFAVEQHLLDYSRLVMEAASGPRRGRLRHLEREAAFGVTVTAHVQIVIEVLAQAQARIRDASARPVPPNYLPASSVQSFDYRYDCASRVEVPSTGSWVVVPVMTCDVALEREYVCVPSVEPKAYRTLVIKNVTPHALLPGPVDVLVGDEFLLTTSLPAIPPGADTQRVGLGVEESIKVARRTQFKENTGGFLGGSTVLAHEVSVELNNRLRSPARVEVRERVPVADPSEKDVKVEEANTQPAWEKIEGPLDGVVIPGARRWRVTVPAGESATLVAQVNVRIPATKMLVGGNRRF